MENRTEQICLDLAKPLSDMHKITTESLTASQYQVWHYTSLHLVEESQTTPALPKATSMTQIKLAYAQFEMARGLRYSQSFQTIHAVNTCLSKN